MNEVYIVHTKGNDSDIIGVFWEESDAQDCADDYNDNLNEAIIIKKSVN